MKDEEVEVHLSSCLRMALALKLNNLIFLLRDSISSIVKNDWTIISPGQNRFFPAIFTRLTRRTKNDVTELDIRIWTIGFPRLTRFF